MKIDLTEFKNNLSTFTAQHLCDIIVSHRYLNIYQEMALLAMEELSRRRSQGDNFDYETYIEEQSNNLPNFKQNNDQFATNFWKNFNLQDLLKNVRTK